MGSTRKLADNRCPEKPVAVVLAGAGARGAYEAGFIATLLPRLQPRPTIFIGTSAGAINAALLASLADRDATSAGAEILKRWRTIDGRMVLGNILRSAAAAMLKYGRGLLAGGDGPSSILDTTPLATSLADKALIDWDKVHTNIHEGVVAVLAVAATESGSGRTKIFFEAHNTKTPNNDEDQAIDYVPVELKSDHVRASAAIPVLFPPVWLDQQENYFLDGGLRLNAPLKPAIAFDAQGIVVVATDSRRYGTSATVSRVEVPTIQDQVAQILRAMFADRMIEDINVLLDKNRIRDASKRARYIPIIFGGPNDAHRLATAAKDAIHERLETRIDQVKHGGLSLLNWLTKVSPKSGPEILSYVLFEPEFIKKAIDAGIEDATDLLLKYENDPCGLWHALSEEAAQKDRTRKTPPANEPTAQV